MTITKNQGIERKEMKDQNKRQVKNQERAEMRVDKQRLNARVGRSKGKLGRKHRIEKRKK